MSAVEKMISAVLKSFDVDVEEIKKDVLIRVQQFETNIDTLNKTLLALNEKSDRIEAKLNALFPRTVDFKTAYPKAEFEIVEADPPNE